MTIAVLAEKPSVARDIARVLHAQKRVDGLLRGNGYAVTWALGHLVTLAEPHQIQARWRRWRASELPMIPEQWPLEVLEKTRDRFEVIARLLCDPDVDEIICATDAGREGELIFRYIYEATGSRKPVRRLWVSSLTEDAIRDGFANLRDGRALDGLADAARGRSRADWLVGMNLSRAYTLAGSDTLSVGRVQTPTLAMLVERELEIRNFVPEDYREVHATFEAKGEAKAEASRRYEGVYFKERSVAKNSDPEAIAEAETQSRRLPADGEEADRIVARAKTGDASIASVSSRQRKLPPPQLYDLTELQRHANRLFGFSAKKTLDIAQSLYESHKLLSYPRTDSRHLSESVAKELPRIVRAITPGYSQLSAGSASQMSAGGASELLAEGTGSRPLGRRFVDDSRVTDHHALLPTTTSPKRLSLSRDEARIYDLVCRRLLAAWHEDHLYSTTTLITAIESPGEAGPAVVDRYRSTGTTIDREGWKVLDPRRGAKSNAQAAGRAGAGGIEPRLPTGLSSGSPVEVIDAKNLSRQTRPPRHFTDSTLLTGMQTAGRTLDDEQLSAAMRATGLGTPATRAAIIETLIQRGYACREKKALVATDKGISLIAVVHPEVRSPRMTGEWESRLQQIERGTGDLESFMRGIEQYVEKVVQRVAGERKTAGAGAATGEATGHREGTAAGVGRATASGAPGRARSTASAADADHGPRPEQLRAREPAPDTGDEPEWVRLSVPELAEPPSGPPPERLLPDDPPAGGARGARAASSRRPARSAPGQLQLGESPRSNPKPTHPRAAARKPREATPSSELAGLLKREFGFPAFRPHQEAVCRAVVEGKDALLVMPTGAGKSLCYQLPGIARAGTTLVISPLIALMEDQVAKLRSQGFAADRIHSGRSRGEYKQIGDAYQDGSLDFLFIAPERLGVGGFPSLLARRTPALIAIDEAHCISQWGHDFRPDYRMLGERLPALRPAPIIAMTATATPLVQRDITKQLGIAEAELHIHGFRRDNIFIELIEARPGARNALAVRLLSEPEHRPAIVYAPTRKKAEELATELAKKMPAAVYHAGIAAARRDKVQSRFLSGELEVIVATIAFGMGIDKPDVRTVVHTAMPASVEGYYQEIGRAGRDGDPSRAVLYHSYADRRTHEWFLDRDYPDASVLKAIAARLTATPRPRGQLERELRFDPDTLEKAVEKLWIHGGAIVDAEDRISRGRSGWEAPYLEQRQHRIEQLDHISRFADGRSCHMLELVRHFGDQEDSGERCGHCASCAPGEAIALDVRTVDASEQAAITTLVDALRERDGQAKGRLHRTLFGDRLDRRAFERVVGGLVRERVLEERADAFERNGETIRFARLYLTEEGLRIRAKDIASLRVAAEAPTGRSRKKSSTRKPTARKPRASREPRTSRKPRTARQSPTSFGGAPESEPPAALVEALRGWRTGEARRRQIPAFRILTDRTLLGIASEIPRDEESLLGVKGMGQTLVRKYGDEILRITREII